jgi:hypothetical protein
LPIGKELCNETGCSCNLDAALPFVGRIHDERLCSDRQVSPGGHSTSSTSERFAMNGIRVVVTVVMCVFLFTIGPLRAAGIPIARHDAAKFGIPLPYYRAFGAVEVLGGIGLLVGLVHRPVGAATAAILAILGLGAVYVHVRAGEPPIKVALAALIAAAAMLLAVVSTWL